MKLTVKNIRHWIADRLSFAACRLRGHKWYLGDSWHSVPGNRATDLSQRIWTDVVFISVPFKDEDQDARARIEKHLEELAQLAGENWGHIWPKESMKTP